MSNSQLLLTMKIIIIYYAVYYVDSSHPIAVGRTLNTLLRYMLWLCVCSGHRQDLESETLDISTRFQRKFRDHFFAPNLNYLRK